MLRVLTNYVLPAECGPIPFMINLHDPNCFSGMLGVPSKHKTPDLLQFTAPCHSQLEMMRIINDGSPNQFMVLLRFRDQNSADEFYRAFNGLPFNSLEPELCSLAYVSKVETCKESEFDPLR